jgi:hypothetical protein
MSDKIEPSPAPRKKHGRPSRWSRLTRDRLLRSAARGLPLVHCATAAGITYQTLSKYRSEKPRFAAALARAISLGVEKRLEVVEAALHSDDEGIRLRAACWFLEKTQSAHFARSRVEVTGADGGQLAIGVNLYLPQKETTIVDASSEPARALTQGGDDGKS